MSSYEEHKKSVDQLGTEKNKIKLTIIRNSYEQFTTVTRVMMVISIATVDARRVSEAFVIVCFLELYFNRTNSSL